MDNYDVVIVGSGTGGQTAAFDLNEKGVKVAVVEKSDRPGGTCALAGCQPKKWFYEAAEAIAKSGPRCLDKSATSPPASPGARLKTFKMLESILWPEQPHF